MIPAKKPPAKFTYSDYLSWPAEERWELIEGVPYSMSPAPSTKHQLISGNLFSIFRNQLKNKSCKIFSAPFDVRLSEIVSNDPDTVVQPDISIFCDPRKLDEKGGKGAPDLIVEILSPSTYNKDFYEKLLLYQKHKVKEYLIVNPETKEIFVHTLDLTGKYDLGVKYSVLDNFNVLGGLEVSGEEVFEGV